MGSSSGARLVYATLLDERRYLFWRPHARAALDPRHSRPAVGRRFETAHRHRAATSPPWLIRGQGLLLLNILRALYRAQKAAGLEPVPSSALRLSRKGVRPFAHPELREVA